MRPYALIFLTLLVTTNAEKVMFKVIAPEAKKIVQVSIDGQMTSLLAEDTDVPYFTGEAHIDSGDSYQYVMDGKAENFTRIFHKGDSTLNEFFGRQLTYATDIPELPSILTEGAWDRGSTNHSIWDSNYIPSIFVTGDRDSMEELIVNVTDSTFKTKITYITAKDVSTFEDCSLFLHKPGKKHNDAKQSWAWTLPEEQLYADRSFFKIRHQEEDPTQLREKLYADLARHMGTYANMANMVRFFINKEGMGTFNLLDDVTMYSYINAMFYNGNPPDRMGALYDGGSGANFSPTSEVENFVANEDSPLEEDALEPFVRAISHVNFTDDEQVKAIGEYFDYDQFLRFMVIEFLTGNWDGYWMEQTNDGAYVDIHNKMVHYLAQDFDATFGVNLAYGDDFVNLPYTEYPKRFPNGYLINKFLTNPSMRNIFEGYLKEATTNLFSTSVLRPYVVARHKFIYPDLEWDRSIVQRSPGNIFGWTIDQTVENLYEGVTAPGEKPGGAEWGLLQWVAAKEEAVAKDLNIEVNSLPVEQEDIEDELSKKQITEPDIEASSVQKNILEKQLEQYDGKRSIFHRFKNIGNSMKQVNAAVAQLPSLLSIIAFFAGVLVVI
ncbi:coth protein-domain-containing protein [Blakeslea trispora]|nr:coth protein-domain-containing protein [Blakeslea trispora]